MSKYTWDIESIKTSDLSDEVKELLIGEFYDKPASIDPSIKRDDLPISEFKRYYFQQKVRLFNDSPLIYNLTSILPKYYKIDNISPVEFKLENTVITEELTVAVLESFIESLEDKEILELAKKVLKESSHIINIKDKDENNLLSERVHGRVIKVPDRPLAYLSLYRRNSFEDFTVIAHEMGHLINHLMFYNNRNQLFNLYSEIESYYFELLMCDHVNKLGELEHNKIEDLLKQNKLLKIIYYIWDMKIQDLCYHQLGNRIRVDKINRKIAKLDTDVYYTAEDILSSLSISLFDLYSMINSYMIALELYELTKKDKEKGLYTYKSMMTDPEFNIEKLLTKYNLDFYNNYDNFTNMYQRSLNLKK